MTDPLKRSSIADTYEASQGSGPSERAWNNGGILPSYGTTTTSSVNEEERPTMIDTSKPLGDRAADERIALIERIIDGHDSCGCEACVARRAKAAREIAALPPIAPALATQMAAPDLNALIAELRALHNTWEPLMECHPSWKDANLLAALMRAADALDASSRRPGVHVMSEQQAGEWVLVPKTLTEEMAAEIECALGTEDLWARALAAAPSPPTEEGGDYHTDLGSRQNRASDTKQPQASSPSPGAIAAGIEAQSKLEPPGENLPNYLGAAGRIFSESEAQLYEIPNEPGAETTMIAPDNNALIAELRRIAPHQHTGDEWRAVMRAADVLEAARPQVAEGWHLVPKEPDSNMAQAWDKAFKEAPEGSGYAWAWEDAYQAMLAAAPSPPAQPQASSPSPGAQATPDSQLPVLPLSEAELTRLHETCHPSQEPLVNTALAAHAYKAALEAERESSASWRIMWEASEAALARSEAWSQKRAEDIITLGQEVGKLTVVLEAERAAQVELRAKLALSLRQQRAERARSEKLLSKRNQLRDQLDRADKEFATERAAREEAEAEIRTLRNAAVTADEAKERAEAERDKAIEEKFWPHIARDRAEAEVARLSSALADAREALVFYAARETWRGDNPPIRHDCDGDFVATPGLKARLAISRHLPPTPEPAKAEEKERP